MTIDNAYKILELSPSCKDDEINKTFKKLAMKHHPDKGGDAEIFKKILEAKEVLLKRNYNHNRRLYNEEYEEAVKEYIRKTNESLDKLEEELKTHNRNFIIMIVASMIFFGIVLFSNWIYYLVTLVIYLMIMRNPGKIYEIYKMFKQD